MTQQLEDALEIAASGPLWLAAGRLSAALQ